MNSTMNLFTWAKRQDTRSLTNELKAKQKAKPCDWCGREFKPKTKHTRWCSKCRNTLNG